MSVWPAPLLEVMQPLAVFARSGGRASQTESQQGQAAGEERSWGA